MSKGLTIIDKCYTQWVQDLCKRYRQSQIKAAVQVNREVLQYYWELGREIADSQYANKYGSAFYSTLSRDIKNEIGSDIGLSPTSIKYAFYFYRLYKEYFAIHPQAVDKLDKVNRPQLVDDLETTINAHKNAVLVSQQLVEIIKDDLFSIPWGHHRYIIDKCSKEPQKALFYVRQTIKNGWSRAMLLNFLDTDLYEREGKALTNFTRTLPDATSDLAQEMTKDPYSFAFTGITKPYNERILKDALLNNITRFLTELGTGFAYVGKEYRLQIGETENFIDLLFYNLTLSCYVVIEVKIGKFAFADAGQLGGYVVACNHTLRKQGRDNPTIGLLICREKDKIQAQYALESSTQPIGISEYDLEKLYPEKVEGTIPTIEEIETKLSVANDDKQ